MASLLDIGRKYAADKVVNHSYLPVYERVIGGLVNLCKGQKCGLLEIGVFEGNSLRMWREWLPPWWDVAGIDIVLPDPIPNVTMHRCNQTDGKRLAELFRKDQFDVVIDDGSHWLGDQLVTMHYLWESLRPGGLYFVEDLQDIGFAACFSMMPGFQVFDLRDKTGRYDDLLAMMRKEQE